MKEDQLPICLCCGMDYEDETYYPYCSCLCKECEMNEEDFYNPKKDEDYEKI